MNTYFFSDPHYNHTNIVAGITRWENKIDECRKFSTVEEMNNTIVNNINNKVNIDDTLYCLGDWSFGGVEYAWEFRKRINCNNVHLILGNHDAQIEKNRTFLIHRLEHVDFMRVTSNKDLWNEVNISPKDPSYLNLPIQSIFASVSPYKEITVNDQKITMFHFPLRSWNKMQHGSWMLHGHEHGRLSDYKVLGKDNNLLTLKTFDVGIDNHPSFEPYDFWELAYIMSQRYTVGVGHHI